MAMPQTGQWRIGGRGRVFKFGTGARSAINFIAKYHRAGVDLDQCGLPERWRGRFARVDPACSDIDQCRDCQRAQFHQMWQSTSNAPFGRDLELAVLDKDGPHALVFACRRTVDGWMNTETKERLDVRPTHWREWNAGHGPQAQCADGS